ncbi:MAG: SDR family oxidoreductase [Sphingomicrobium sp.]
MTQQTRNAVVIGADRPFGREILERLGAEGYALVDGGGSGPIDLLVVNRPVEAKGIAFREIDDAEFMAAVSDQLYDLVAAGQSAAPRMTGGGTIVVIASRAHLGGWGGAHVMAAGAALVGMSRSMALELAGQGVRVNVIAAPFVGEPADTPLARADVAGTVIYLAGPDGGSITGETLLLNRGDSLRMGEGRRR